MRKISNLFNKPEEDLSFVTLESKPVGDLDEIKTDANTVKVTPATARIPAKDLENAYIKEPTTFNLVNVMTQLIMSPDHGLDGDKSEVDFMTEILDNVGFYGGTNTWEQILTLIFKHQVMFGNAYLELITDGTGDKAKVIDFDIIDPKMMDYAKDGNGNIVMDELGRPVGYTQTVPEESGMIDLEPFQKAKVPEEIALKSNQLYIPKERIIHYKLHSLGDVFYPLGFIEPAYNSITYKLKLEGLLANAILRDGFPTLIGKYGDNQHVPTPNQVQDLLNNMQNLTSKHTFAVPYYVDIQYLESKSVVQLREHLVYFTEQIVTSFGIPQAIATATGEATNRATLTSSISVVETILYNLINNTNSQTEYKLFMAIARRHGKSKIPTMFWDNINTTAIKDELIPPEPVADEPTEFK